MEKRESDVCRHFGSCALGAGRPGQAALFCVFWGAGGAKRNIQKWKLLVKR